MGDQTHFELDQFEIDPTSVRRLGRRFCQTNHVVVLGRVDWTGSGPIHVGMLRTDDDHLNRLLASALGRSIEPVQLNGYEIEQALGMGFDGESEPVRHRFMLELTPTRKLEFIGDHGAEELIEDIVSHAITLGASDIHIETFENDVDVRYRIDGMLEQQSTPLSPDNIRSVISRLKILCDLDIAERRRALDGRIYARYGPEGDSRAIDLRLAIIPGPHGEDAVMRVLDSLSVLVGLDKLGMAEHDLRRFGELVENPEGMVLVSGPTGSGKTTTLYSALAAINKEHNKVLTAEDPIEYAFPKTNQKQVTSTMSFADYARAFLRQDPDIMLIGEIRDEETAHTTMKAVQSGHLVLSTVHTGDASGVIGRLNVFGIDPNLIADNLLGSLSQRLVRRLCTKCGEVVEPDAFAKRVFTAIDREFPVSRASGCEACRQTGYKGRTGVFELMVVDDTIRDLINRQAPTLQIRRQARERGMRTLFEDALDKVQAGVTSFEEVRRVVPYRAIREVLDP